MGSIVQEYGEPNGDYADPPLASLCRKAAVENGIERPYGYEVSFHYNSAVESHHFGRSHPMKPWRLHLTKQLVLSYGLQYAMDLYEPRAATREELEAFHKSDYLDFISRITPENMHLYEEELTEEDLKDVPKERQPAKGERATRLPFNFGDDCPVFDGLYAYCTMYTGSSVSAARTLAATNPPGSNNHDIAVNWSGGLHHAQKGWASGFCYVNDIVLAILVLLRTHPRVLYIDIDVHHGDGVEAAFTSSDRVMTLSYHKYDPETFFPGTGGLYETGPSNFSNPGAKYSLNVPLRDGIDDDEYYRLFSQITGKTIETFRPTAIVLQCGADSLGGDRLGKFNLNIKAHGECVEFVKKFQLPLMLLGGGGYTARNVARLWTHETSLAINARLPESIPDYVPYRQAFLGEENGSGQLYPNLSHLEGRRHKNEHSEQYLQELIKINFEHLRYIAHAPSVQMHRVPTSDVWRLREQVDDELREDAADNNEAQRRERERNIGGRGELPV